jgi:RecB family endonuclease NucS
MDQEAGMGTTERDLKCALHADAEQLEARLTITDGGKEQIVKYGGKAEPGFIDITAKDRDGTTVVIELKAGKAGRHAIGQILGYMGVLMQGKKPIRGILVAKEFSPQGIAAARPVPNLQLSKYTFRAPSKFTFEIVSARQER